MISSSLKTCWKRDHFEWIHNLRKVSPKNFWAFPIPTVQKAHICPFKRSRLNILKQRNSTFRHHIRHLLTTSRNFITRQTTFSTSWHYFLNQLPLLRRNRKVCQWRKRNGKISCQCKILETFPPNLHFDSSELKRHLCLWNRIWKD